jgi:molybdopterin molybdotransferase
MLITTGGAATGDYDFAYKTAEMLGGEVLFWKVAMRPGGALLAYTLNGKLVLSLSGNPGAAALGLLHIALPYIKKLCGRTDVLCEKCTLKLRKAQQKKNPVLRLIRGFLVLEDGEAYFEAEGGQGGGDLSSLIKCNLIAEIPAGTPQLEAGALVTAYRVGL